MDSTIYIKAKGCDIMISKLRIYVVQISIRMPMARIKSGQMTSGKGVIITSLFPISMFKMLAHVIWLGCVKKGIAAWEGQTICP